MKISPYRILIPGKGVALAKIIGLVWAVSEKATILLIFISKNNPWRLVRPLRLAHLAHITSTANQDANT